MNFYFNGCNAQCSSRWTFPFCQNCNFYDLCSLWGGLRCLMEFLTIWSYLEFTIILLFAKNQQLFEKKVFVKNWSVWLNLATDHHLDTKMASHWYQMKAEILLNILETRTNAYMWENGPLLLLQNQQTLSDFK